MRLDWFAKASICFVILGVLILALIIPYYAFDWGIQPCTGLPSDAGNCGDADMGGAGLMLLALPFLLVGIAGLFIASIRTYLRSRKAARKQ